MADIRQLIRSGINKDSNRPRWITALTLLALVVVIGLVPALVIGIGPVAISTGTLAGLFLLGRRYEVFNW